MEFFGETAQEIAGEGSDLVKGFAAHDSVLEPVSDKAFAFIIHDVYDFFFCQKLQHSYQGFAPAVIFPVQFFGESVFRIVGEEGFCQFTQQELASRFIFFQESQHAGEEHIVFPALHGGKAHEALGLGGDFFQLVKLGRDQQGPAAPVPEKVPQGALQASYQKVFFRHILAGDPAVFHQDLGGLS